MAGTNTTTDKIVIIDMGVGGMTCDDCIDHVTEALESVPGVNSATFNLDDRSAVVEARADVSTDALSGAVRQKGYNVFERRRSEDAK